MSFNRTILQGRCTRAPEVKTVGGTQLAKFAVAVNRKRKEGDDEVLFMEIQAWGATADVAGNYLQKGSSVLVEGRLKQESWTEGETKKSRILLVADQLVLLDAKQDAIPVPMEKKTFTKPSTKLVNPTLGADDFDLPF